MSTFRLKTKITLGVLFLYLMLALVSVVGVLLLRGQNEKSRMILQDNYESLEDCQNMLRALEQMTDNRQQAMTAFDRNLMAEESNLTETGEARAAHDVRVAFTALQNDSAHQEQYFKPIRQGIANIMAVNMRAIKEKHVKSNKTGDHALIYIAVIIGVCFMLGFTFVFNFPGYIANPIRELTEGIKNIAQKKYSQRLYFKSDDEFGDLAEAFNTMAAQLDQYEHSNLARIMFEKKRAEAVISSLKDATIGFDANDTILFANQPALDLLNMKERDLVGFAASVAAKNNDLLRTIIHQQAHEPLKIVVDGKECFFVQEVIDIHQEEARTGYVIILKNITSFLEHDQAKTRFIATISHELKTPLAASDFSLKLLEDERIGTLSGEQKELVESLKQDNRRMIRIVSELLDLSQVESGNIQLQVTPVFASGIVKYALDAVTNAAARADIRIDVQVADNLPPILADVEKSAWVLVNLLTNAIRYSKPGSTVTLAVTVTDTRELQFSVRDTGKGIAPAFREKIFERFFKVPGAQHPQGTGLGLAISREFIDAQGGRIGVESEEGKGSLFYFMLPLAPGNDSANTP
ncbi:PAS domain-containing sensor histidine kinase [Chitinophaga parva]|uniref:histidine kinase n=1 Tax=Chitinophaga parva TaxID=2169414 RepID=A0A2T7BLJ1_9BACT|nr:ATP-binding protein [Chitinophaga parva]PUZ28526.1 PAS domain-containing sensor histidine kinase [Chitinophaga parva]